MKTVGKCFDRVELGLKWASGILLVVFTALTLLQVVMRYCFSAPLSWSEQLSRYLFIWMLMLYMPVIMRDRGNLGFDLIVKALPKKAQQILELFCNALICAFAGLYCVYSAELVEKFANRMLVGLNIKAPWVYSAQIVGAGILCIFTLEMVINDIIALTKKTEKEAE